MSERVLERGMQRMGDLLAPFITEERRDRLRSHLSRLLTGRVVTHRELAGREDTLVWRYDEAWEYTFAPPPTTATSSPNESSD